MTENEAKIFIQNVMEQTKKLWQNYYLLLPKCLRLEKRAWVSFTAIWRIAKRKFMHVRRQSMR